MKNSRRQFMILSAAGACTLALNGKVQAQAMVAETDPQAAALGYKADASKVDKAKFPKYAAGQQCSNCALFQGKADAAAGAAHCLLVSKFPPKAGAQLMLRKRNC
jgi:hypothetical protein